MVRPDYNQYTKEDHQKALAYRLLASAELEHYVESRCLEVAQIGCDRIGKSQLTATGRALIVWLQFQDQRSPAAVPIHEGDPLALAHLAQKAMETYARSVKKSHGISEDDLRRLVFPLGLRESQVPAVLAASLEAFAKKRNPASHTHVNRAKTQSEPVEEVKAVEQILVPLRQLDADLKTVSETFPINHL